MLNIALFAPMPKASVTMATAANPESFFNFRNAYTKSRVRVAISGLLVEVMLIHNDLSDKEAANHREVFGRALPRIPILD
jgi:hypothetical protein